MTEELLTKLFLKVVNMSVSAGWLVLAVLALRALLRKAPKWTAPALWAIVGLRLVMPFSVESVLSLIPSAETVSPEIIYAASPAIESGVAAINQAVNPIITENFAPVPGNSANPLQIWLFLAAVVWLIGVVALLLYAVSSYLRLRRRMDTAVLLRDNLYRSERAASPFVLGIVHPKIYLPFSLPEGETGHVVAHEQAHIARRDHWWKPLGFLLLAVHWFNPLLWVAYLLLCRDIELACDERVIRTLEPGLRADYSQALLECSAPRRPIAACPLAFGEVGVKERVKQVLSYKKPAFWLSCAAVLVCAAVAVCFLTNPVQAGGEAETGPVVWRDEANSGDFPYELHLPESWRGKFTASEAVLRRDGEGNVTLYSVEFSQTRKSAPDLGGTICTLVVRPDRGESEAELLPPVPSVYLGRGGGWIYFLYFASDVQVDPANKRLAQEYQTMYQDALTQMGPDRFVLRLDSAGPTEPEPAIQTGWEAETTGFSTVSWTTPAGLTETAYNILYGQAGGVLFQPDAYRAAEEYTPPDWYAAGSVCEYYTDGIILWDGNKIGHVFSFSNHSVLEEVRPLEGLCAPAFLVKESHDLYTAVDMGKMEEAGTDLDTVELTSNYWYVYFARPGEEKGVVISLNAKNFTEADILEFARSVRY